MTGTVHESDLVLPTVRLLAAQPDGFMTTSDLIAELEDIFNPSGHDAQIATNRSDTYFTQKVRNMISHRSGPSSFIANGYAEYVSRRRGLQITDAGRLLLKSLGG